MDILNAPVFERQHAARPEIRAVRLERQVKQRFGEQSPYAKELAAIPTSRPHTIIERAVQMLAEPEFDPERALREMLNSTNRELTELVTDNAQTISDLAIENARLKRIVQRLWSRRQHKPLTAQGAVKVIQRQEATIRDLELRNYKLDQRLASAPNTLERDLQRLLRPRGYRQDNVVDAVHQVCRDCDEAERKASRLDRQIEAVKRGYGESNADIVSVAKTRDQYAKAASDNLERALKAEAKLTLLAGGQGVADDTHTTDADVEREPQQASS